MRRLGIRSERLFGENAINAFGHLTGQLQLRVIDVEEFGWRRQTLRCIDQGADGPVHASITPKVKGLFDEPRAVDVFQETDATLEAAFVAEIILKRGVRDTGMFETKCRN